MSDRQADLRALYQSVILEHNRSPHNRGAVSEETHRARGFNPLCGDDITVSMRIADGQITEVGFEGKGCAICTAAASCMTQACDGRGPEQVIAVAADFEAMVRGGDTRPSVGLLEAFAPVAGFPSRIKCAILPWRALVHALNGDEGIATTEEP